MKNKLDALDLRENALRSICFLESSVNVKMNYMPYFRINFAVTPPRFEHVVHFDDPENIARWYYGLTCAQMVSGTRRGERLRRGIEREIARRLAGPFGFMYTSKQTARFCPEAKEPYTWLWGDRSALQAWVLEYMRSADAKARGRYAKWIRNMVGGLQKFSIRIGKYVLFPAYKPRLSYKKPSHWKLPVDAEGILSDMQSFDQGKAEHLQQHLMPPSDSFGGMIFPLVQWYEAGGDKRALDLAVGISNSVVDFYTASDNKRNPVGCMSNNHGTLNSMAGVLAAARHVPSRRHVSWARMLFEFYSSRCGSSFGWIMENESVDPQRPLERPSCEGCAAIDFVSAGIELAKAGFLECWDIVERSARNYLTRAQPKHIGPISLEGVTLNLTEENRRNDSVPPELYDDRDIARRAVGCMAGWGAPNDVLDPRGKGAMCVQNCCSSHLPFGLYRVWEHIAVMKPAGLYVNFLLNHTGRWCDVRDYQPGEGRVDIKMKTSGYLYVRMPEWVAKDKVRVKIGKAGVDCAWDESKRYVAIKNLGRGAKVTITYPLRRWKVKELLGGTVYTTDWIGDTVVGIDPPGRFIPVFG
ncbi:MAG: hypothetical protein WC299_10965 [Kiritimatiellia bacterium]